MIRMTMLTILPLPEIKQDQALDLLSTGRDGGARFPILVVSPVRFVGLRRLVGGKVTTAAT